MYIRFFGRFFSLNIVLDLGTLFSTASYALTGEDKQADDVHDITKWYSKQKNNNDNIILI